MTHFDIKDPVQRDYFIFNSETPFERIHGFSNAVYGTFEIDPDNLKNPPKGEIKIDLRAMDTGNEFRNEKLKQKLFFTFENPFMMLTIAKWSGSVPPKLNDKVPVSIKTEVVWQFKGQKKTEILDLKLTYFKATNETKFRLPGNLLKVQFSSSFQWEAWGVAIPSDIKNSVSPKWTMELSAVGTDSFLSLLQLPKIVE